MKSDLIASLNAFRSEILGPNSKVNHFSQKSTFLKKLIFSENFFLCVSKFLYC